MIHNMIKKWLLFCLLLILFLSPHSTSRAQASDTTYFADDFSGDLSKWQDNRSNFENWSIVDGQLEASIDTSFTVNELVPADLYWDDSIENFEYSLDFTAVAGADRNISFSIEDNLNWFEFHFVGTKILLCKVVNGRVVWSVQVRYPLDNRVTYHLSITKDDDRVILKIDDEIVIDELDPDPEIIVGKIGVKATTGSVHPTVIRFDNILVTSIDNDVNPTPTPPDLLEHILQTDPAWSQNEYDSANNWSSDPSIGRWGCSLTSMTMILKYYGIDKLPGDIPMDPATLNDWLKSQLDGYLPNGSLNWVAVTRLTEQMHEVYQTPKLEYSKDVLQPLVTASNEIQEQRPVIIQIPGHFFPADGVNDDQTDLFIKDPWFPHTLLSQHQQTIASTRSFLPSYTDLSYLVIAHQPELNLNLSAPDEELDLSHYSSSEFIRDPDNPTSATQEMRVVELPKPIQGEYQLNISQDELAEFNLTIWAYDQAGNVTNLSQTGMVGPDPQNYIINFSPTGNSSIHRHVAFEDVQTILTSLEIPNQLDRYSNLIIINRLLEFAIGAYPDHTDRYINLITQTINNLSNHFDPTTQSYLLQELALVETHI